MTHTPPDQAQQMDIYEFYIRLWAYRGLSRRFGLGWDEATCLSLVPKASHGTPDKKLHECSIDELHTYTLQTYAPAKHDFLTDQGANPMTDAGTLGDYINRLEYELYVVHQMGFDTYFLVVADFIGWARDNDIVVGPGRGSAAGALFSYCVGIIDIDPLPYDLLYERFLNPARITMPDIDTDFEDRERERVIDYVVHKYGSSNVAHIGTYMTMAAKAAFKDVARAKGMRFMEANRLSTMIKEKTLDKSIAANEELAQQMEQNPLFDEIMQLARKLEGNTRQTGVHACGVIISPEPVTNYTPVQLPPKADSTERVVSQYDGHYLEDIGLIKMDFLGLRNLSIIKDTCKIIRATAKKNNTPIPDVIANFFETLFLDAPLDDDRVYETVFQAGNTSGVFQFESDGMRTWLRKLKPSEINDVIAMVALYRPGPMEFIPSYIDRKHGIEEVSYHFDELHTELTQRYSKEIADEQERKLDEDLGPFMNITYGISVYQEQLMRLVQAMAGFSLAEADLLRRGVGKKKHDVIKQLKAEFVTKAESYHGYKPETSAYIYEKMIMPAADYSFNKSHAACYALIAYQTAYLKTHYPTAFHAALLRSAEEDPERLSQLIDELATHGVRVNPPDINRSFAHVAAIDDEIYLGFIALRGIGYEVGKAIENERETNGLYTDIGDFFRRCPTALNKKTIETLGKSGCFDIWYNRATILDNITTIIERHKHVTQAAAMGGGLFGGEITNAPLELTPLPKAPYSQLLSWDYDVFKTIVSSHPLDGIYSYIKKRYNFFTQINGTNDFGAFKLLCMVRSIRKTKTKGVFVTFEGITGTHDIYMSNPGSLAVLDIVHIEGYKRGERLRLEMIKRYDADKFVAMVDSIGIRKDNESVIAVRAARMSTTRPAAPPGGSSSSASSAPSQTAVPPPSTNKQADPPSPPIPETQQTQQTIVDTAEDSDTTAGIMTDDESKTDLPLAFDLPDEIDALMALREIITSHPGTTAVTIGGVYHTLSDEGVELLRTLIG